MTWTTADEIEAAALTLNAGERARLARRLLASLDEPAEIPQAEIDRAWAEEIGRRLAEYERGEVRTIPAGEVFARLRQPPR